MKTYSFVKEGNISKIARENIRKPSLLEGCMDCHVATDLKHNFIFPTEIALTTKRPDIVIWSVKAKKVFVIELTVPCEENFDWAHQRKLEKYEDMREQCVRNGWITNVFSIEVGWRGFIANSTSVFLTNLGLPPSDKRKYMEKIQDKALTASAWIWQSHRATTIRQSLVVSWDTSGALWVIGNDASAPKPCLNPESSSDEAMLLYKHQFLYDTYYSEKWPAIDRLSIIWESDFFDKIKMVFSTALVVSVLM